MANQQFDFMRELGYILKGAAGNPQAEAAAAVAEANKFPSLQVGPLSDRGVPLFGQGAGVPLYGQGKPLPTQVDPETVMSMPSVDPASVMSMPEEANMSVAPQMSVAPPTAVKSSVPVKPAGGGKAMAAGGAPKAAPAPAAVTSVQTPEDEIMKRLLAKQELADADARGAKDKAEEARNLSDSEKIFMSLMAVLPGLAGAIGGGALAGSTGATAGLAGGLGGAAQGVGMVNQEKEDRVKEALGQATQAQERSDQAGNQMLGHQERLGDRAYGTSEREASQKFAGEQTDKQIANSRFQMLSNQRHESRMLDKKHGFDMEQAYAAAAAKGPGEVKDFQQKSAEAAGDMIIAADDITEFQKGIKDNGLQSLISGGSWADIMKNPQTQKFGVAVARFMNAYLHHTTGAAISEEEWKQAKSMFVPSFSDDDATRTMKERYRVDAATAAFEGAGPAQSSVRRRLDAYDKVKPRQQPNPQVSSASPTTQLHSYVKWDGQ